MSGKIYVVWEGRSPGIYLSWDEAEVQVANYPGAKFKAFSSRDEAIEAYRGYVERGEIPLGELLIGGGRKEPADALLQIHSVFDRFPEIDRDAWAVDASCLGNPGVMEYRGVELKTGRQIFRVGPFQDATNNMGEFLAIVHALALMEKNGEKHTIYSDSRTGMAWVRDRKIKTTLKPTEANKKVFELLARGINWLDTHSFRTRILKWQTELWGEIPADFGRK